MDPKWKYHNFIYDICERLHITEDEFYKKNYISTLNWKSYFHERDIVIKNMSK